jgi:hypothetical protein
LVGATVVAAHRCTDLKKVAVAIDLYASPPPRRAHRAHTRTDHGARYCALLQGDAPTQTASLQALLGLLVYPYPKVRVRRWLGRAATGVALKPACVAVGRCGDRQRSSCTRPWHWSGTPCRLQHLGTLRRSRRCWPRRRGTAL